MIEWHIQSRSHHCQRCGAVFKEKEPFHTLLFEERLGYSRLDACESCWKEAPSEGAPRAISHWQSVYVPPPAAPPEPIQKENAESLLRKLVELHNPAHMACCYILAAMLERKRILKVKEQFKRDGQRIFLYEHPKSGDLFTIVDPDLQLDQLEEVQRDVALLLERGVGPSETSSPPATSNSGSSGNSSEPALTQPLHPQGSPESGAAGQAAATDPVKSEACQEGVAPLAVSS